MTESLQMSLADVAALARVRRPVVSVWRTRSSGADLPFPAAVATVRGEERFDVEDVIGWLEQTGRGNNPDVRGDAAAFALPKGLTAGGDEDLFTALTALLCLTAVRGEPLTGLGGEQLLQAAVRADPGDALLVRELEGVGDRLGALAGFADRATDAAYGPAAAFERLMAERFRLSLRGHAATHLSPSAHLLVVAVAMALAHELGVEPGIFTDPTGGSDLLVSLLTHDDDLGSATALTPDDDSATSRLTRRRLRVHDLHRAPLAVDNEGTFAVDGPAVHLACFPTPSHPALDPLRVLTGVDNIQLQMSDIQRAVVLAPASVLTDPLTDRGADELRDQLLRLGRLRAVVRLPRRLVTARPNQALALWVLGPSHAGVRHDERWTAVADLSDVSLIPSVVDDLVSDLVAAMGDQTSVRSHAFRFARLAPTSRLLASRTGLVQPRAERPHGEHSSPADIALQIRQLRHDLVVSTADPLAEAEIVMAQEGPEPRSTTVADAVGRGLLRVVPGNRLDPNAEAGQVPVIGVGELTGQAPVGSRTIDRLVFLGTYDAARLTQPADVVFCTSPRPAATVDGDGGSAVAFPARVLRIAQDRSGLLPEVVANDINTQPSQARSWRTWTLHLVPADDQRAVLREILHAVSEQQAEARARVERLERLRRLLVEGVTGHGLILDTRSTPAEHTTAPMEGS